MSAIASGYGREIFSLDEDGQIKSVASDKCITLADGDTYDVDAAKDSNSWNAMIRGMFSWGLAVASLCFNHVWELQSQGMVYDFFRFHVMSCLFLHVCILFIIEIS